MVKYLRTAEMEKIMKMNRDAVIQLSSDSESIDHSQLSDFSESEHHSDFLKVHDSHP